MRKLFDRVFARYGTEALLYTGKALYTVKVFFQSFNSRSWENMERILHPLGYVPSGQYICMLPANAVAEAGSILSLEGKDYVICRVEKMPICTNPAYQWAICTGKEDWDL